MLCTNSDDVVSAIVGSLAAAVECEKEGNIPVTPDDLLAKLELVERRVNFGNWLEINALVYQLR